MITLEAFSRLADEAIQHENTDVQRAVERIAEAAAGGALFVQIDAEVARLARPECAAEHLRAAGLLAEYRERAGGQRVLHVQWAGE